MWSYIVHILVAMGYREILDSGLAGNEVWMIVIQVPGFVLYSSLKDC